MAALAPESTALNLPTRIRNKLGPDTEYAARFAIAERIAALAHVQIVEDAQAAFPGRTCVYLEPDLVASCQRVPAVLYCRIDYTGISVEGLSDSERNHILCRGWGQLEHRRVKLFLPRDDGEVEVCWNILYRAYNAIINSPGHSPSTPRAYFGDLPEVSRTFLA